MTINSPSDNMVRHRRMQFSCRAMLICMTGLALWLGGISQRLRQKQRAVEIVARHSGKVYYDHGTTTSVVDYRTRHNTGMLPNTPAHASIVDLLRAHIVGLFLSNTTLSNDDFECLSCLDHIKELRMLDVNIVDDGLCYVGKMRSLRSLELFDSLIPPQSLHYLAALENLEYLGISANSITPMELTRLARRLPRLRQVCINQATAHDEEALCGLEKHGVTLMVIPVQPIPPD